ncbi:MAG: hypothetical protein AAF960_14870 [Bacteroidota bacterium]
MTTSNAIFLVLATVLAAIIFLGVTAERHIEIKLTKFIDADLTTVYDQIRHLERYTDWSPYKVQDPEQITSVKGTDGTVGATFFWEGAAEESKGSMALIELNEANRLTFECNVEVPFEGQSIFSYELADEGNGTVVTQTFTTELKFLVNIIGKLIGLRKEMEATNQQGMDLLKKVTESQVVAAIQN